MTESQAIITALFFLGVTVCLAVLFYYERRLAEYEGFISSDRMWKVRFDLWRKQKNEKGTPGSQNPPTE